MTDTIDVAILGASGYTGAELVRLLVGHPRVRIAALTADRRAGQAAAEVFPHLFGLELPTLCRIEEVDWSAIPVAFCALPHATTQEVIAALPRHVKAIDLSADFRFDDFDLYAATYGRPHQAPDLQSEAVYGLTEIARDEIKQKRIVACPGCYPTVAQLPLLPLLAAGLIETDPIVIDAKSGVSGAGRSASETTLFAEVSEGFHAYGIAGHRHAPEIEQGLGRAAGRPVTVSFTPHLVPMNRGILATAYVKLAPGATVEQVRGALETTYADSPFVHLLPQGQAPATRHVKGSNLCLIGVFADRVPGRVILISAIDNLVKGASGQAVQNLNVAMGWDEALGLDAAPVFP